MNTTKRSIDMLHGSLGSGLIVFALPIAFSSMLQQLFNAADTAVVGYFADSNALAAVGTNGEIVALLVTLSAGLSVGANVLLARCIGENQLSHIRDIIHTAISLSLIAGLLIAGGGQLLVRPVLLLIKTPPEVLNAAILYLRIYLAGLPVLLLYDFGSAILRSRGDSRSPFLALMISGMINVLLNLFFVIVCHLDVVGVAVATDLATACSAAIVLWKLHRETGEFHLSLRHLCIRRQYLLSILQIGVPSAVQGAVFCFANIFVQTAVNSFGAIATAGSTIAMNFEYFGYYMITAFGQAATTFTSQNFAAGNKKRCLRILFLSVLFSAICSAVITVPLTVFRGTASGLFTNDPAVIQAACTRIALILAFEPICSLYEIPAGSLRGMGHSSLPAVLTILGTCLLRILWIFTVFQKYHTQECLFIIFPVSWVVTILLMMIGFLCCANREFSRQSKTSQPATE